MLLRVLLLSSLIAALARAERPHVVVTGVISAQPLRAMADSVNEQLLTELSRSEQVEAIGTSDLAQVLGLERQKQLLGCAEASTSCIAELAAAMGAPWLVTGNLAQVGSVVRLDVKLIRALDGKAIFRDGVSLKDQAEVFEAVTGIARRLLRALLDDGQPRAAPGPSTVAPWVVIGVGSAAGVTGAALAVAAFVDQSAKLRAIAAQTDPVPSYDEARAPTTTLRIGLGVAAAGALAVVAGVVWRVAGVQAPAEVSVVPLRGGSGLTVGGRF